MDNENTKVSAEETKSATISDKETVADTEKKSQNKKAKPAEKPPEPEKTYTRAEVDKMLENERRSADGKAEEALKKIELLEKKNACLSAGIKPDFTDDAITLAGRLVNENTDFSAALKAVSEKYPQFTGADVSTTEKSEKPVNTGVKTKNSPEDFDKKALREAFGLK